MTAIRTSEPIANCWRQCCDSRRQVVTMLQTARKWEFTHYSVIRSGQHYWLSCTRMAPQQLAHDYAHALRLRYPQVEQFIAITERHQHLNIVIWCQQQLIVSMTLNTSKTEQLWLIERIREWTDNWELSDTTLLLEFQSDSSIGQFLQHHCSTAHWLEEPAHTAPHRATRLRPVGESLPWQRRQQLWLSVVVSAAIALSASWWFWPQPQTPAPQLQTQKFEIAGIPLAELAQILEYQYQANLIAGWQFQEATLRNGQWTIFMRATYGTVSELRQQTPLVVSHDAQSTRLETRFASPVTITPQQLPSEQSRAREQLESLLVDWQEHIKWKSRSAPADELMRWHDYELRWLPSAAGMDRQFAQVLQQLPGRLLQYRWSEGEQELTLTVRFYWLSRHSQEIES